MSEPRRLLEEGGDDLAVSLLRSARHDAPSPRARKETLAALGLGAGAAVTAAAATSTAASAATAAKSGATAALLKWIGVGVVGGLVTVTTVAVVQSPPPEPAPAVLAPTGTRAIASPARSAEPRPVEVTPAPSAEPVASAAPEAQKPARPPVSADKPEASAKPTLADEVASLDAARSALASGNASAALRALDDHDRRFPGGALGPEGTVLRIEALAQRGDRGSAAALARAFLAAHPRSPHAARIRSVALPAEETAP
jgi:TolA-binding protein